MKTIFEFNQKKTANEKITMITCYDYSSATIIDQTDIDSIIVGDSVSMVMHGCNDPTGATLEMMVMHTQAVSRGIKNKFIVSDLPFMSYRKSLSKTMSAMESLIRVGANAIKLEGADGNLKQIKHAVESGIPIMGHLGLTPQHFHALGGFKVQGKDEFSKNKILTQAKQLEDAGCFALVLECVPSNVAQEVTKMLRIPTIGIGAGVHTDGQVLVMHDLLGYQTAFKPKFLKHYFNCADAFKESINSYVHEVREKIYPAEENCY